jgi:hypothetical protein
LLVERVVWGLTDLAAVVAAAFLLLKAPEADLLAAVLAPKVEGLRCLVPLILVAVAVARSSVLVAMAVLVIVALLTGHKEINNE